jgi:hypothetical protein
MIIYSLSVVVTRVKGDVALARKNHADAEATR